MIEDYLSVRSGTSARGALLDLIFFFFFFFFEGLNWNEHASVLVADDANVQRQYSLPRFAALLIICLS